MKTIAVLTRLLPTINNVRGSGAFNVVIASAAATIAEDLRKATNADRIVATPLLGALDGLAKAREFEAQQSSMALVAELADKMLGDIASGDVERAAVVPLNVVDITQRIGRAARSLQDVFKVEASALREIRADASELTSLVDAEIREGARDPEHAVIAAQIYDIADRIPDEGYADRQRGLAAIAGYTDRLAA